MPEATFVRDFGKTRITAAGAYGAGELIQLANGKAGYYDSTTAASTGDGIVFTSAGTVTVAKATGVVLLDGGRAYWDHSANNVTFKPVNDRDFYVGTIVGDSGSGDSVCTVDLNAQQENIIDFNRDVFATVLAGTPAVTAAGFGDPRVRGGGRKFHISSTSEAQKVDMLSQRGFARTANAIVEFIFNVIDDGAGTVVDVSMGLANATHATDADSITESLFIHLNANDVNVYAESDDGSTEVAATDTTVDYTAATPIEVWMDLRNEADIQIYLDGVLVLGATVFKLDAATGPLKGLIHIEKTSAADVYELDVDRFVVRLAQQ